MLKPKSPQTSFYGSYLFDRIVPQDHLLRKINKVVDFSFVNDIARDRYTPDFGRPAEDPEFMLRPLRLPIGETKAEDRLVSPIDADARAGKKTSKSWAGYKGHVIIEEDSAIITAIVRKHTK